MVFGGKDEECERDLDITGLYADLTSTNILVTAQSYKLSGYGDCPTMDLNDNSAERTGLVALINTQGESSFIKVGLSPESGA